MRESTAIDPSAVGCTQTLNEKGFSALSFPRDFETKWLPLLKDTAWPFRPSTSLISAGFSHGEIVDPAVASVDASKVMDSRSTAPSTDWSSFSLLVVIHSLHVVCN